MKVLWMLVLLLALLLLAGLLLFFKNAVRKRDKVRTPREAVYGTGTKRALLLYQPSNHESNVPLTLALAQTLADSGYTVTVNYPSALLPYDLADYDALLFGTNVYLGETALPLRRYLQAHTFTGKAVLIYVTGARPEETELAALAALVPPGNTVYSLKLRAEEREKLLAFARDALS